MTVETYGPPHKRLNGFDRGFAISQSWNTTRAVCAPGAHGAARPKGIFAVLAQVARLVRMVQRARIF